MHEFRIGRKTKTPKAARQCLRCLPSFTTTHKKNQGLVLFSWDEQARTHLHLCWKPVQFFLKQFSPFALYSCSYCLKQSRVWLFLNNSTSPVGVQWLEVRPTALADLIELLTELSLSVTLLRKKKRIGTMEPQLVITTWRAMVLCLSPSPPEPFEGTP